MLFESVQKIVFKKGVQKSSKKQKNKKHKQTHQQTNWCSSNKLVTQRVAFWASWAGVECNNSSISALFLPSKRVHTCLLVSGRGLRGEEAGDALAETTPAATRTTHLKNNDPIERPILGLGINDHVEIGSGRAILLTLADHGYDKIEVHIPKSNKDDFKKYMT